MHTFQKHIAVIGMLFLTVLALGGCSKKSKEVTVDAAKLAADLSSQAVSSEALTEMASAMVADTYYISKDIFANGVAYRGSGATACEVAVIECKDAGQTKDVEAKLKEHVASQSDLYASYNAGEVEKLDKAVIKSAGKYTVLCVCDDTGKAESILKESGF